ncbi:MAG: MlaD family protein [Candidatus Aegiribacteria sp.]|nr:MlaD family protein [Candidatus Aegiribacteria sp.]
MTGNKFRLGLFFFIGILFTIFLIVWLSGGLKATSTTTYVSYFSWSVQGLNEGSAVMYNGVSIGHVTSIDIAPDGRLVEVLMKIRSEFSVDSTIVATMQIIGITGLRVLNLSADSTQVHHPSYFSFEVEYQIIPVGEGAIQNVTATLTRITEIIHEIDFKNISDQFTLLLENTNAIMASDKIERIEDAILSNSANLDSLLITYTRLGENLNQLVLTLNEIAPDLAMDVDVLIQELRAFSEPLNRFVDKIDDVLINSSEMMNNLSNLLEILGRDPSELFIRTSGEGVWQ